MKYWLLNGAFLILLLGACGKDKNGGNLESSAEEANYAYSMSDSGCDTGQHFFRTLADKCAGLRSRSLNKGCALQMRRDEFRANCSGVFTETD
jgi:hypothetical protein